MAYVLAIISAEDKTSIIPNWVNRTYPAISNIIIKMRNTPCAKKCLYCQSELNINKRLKQIFGYDSFRKYDGENLQEEATQAAVENESLLAVFPTGGGKSITFQLPALIAGETAKALTIVISPLQSLMKDQVDNLEKRGIVDAVTIDRFITGNVRVKTDEKQYEKPKEILLQLSHKDVHLGYFKNKKHIIRKLKGGIRLDCEQNGLSVKLENVRHKILLFSEDFKEKIEMNRNILLSCRIFILSGEVLIE